MSKEIERLGRLSAARQARRRAGVALEAGLELYVLAHGVPETLQRLQAEIDHLQEFARKRSATG